jgi:rod shape-determining protein MreC
MKRIVNRKGLTVLGVVALIIVLITAVTMSVSNGREGFFGRTVAAVTKPARSFFSQIADSLERLYGYMYKYDQLAEENAQLRLEIAQMEQTRREYQDILDENERLRELLSLSDRHSDYNYATAKIIAWGGSSFSSSFTINKGSDDGLQLNQCVITETGYLVGAITELTATTATVTTIIDTDSGVGALVYDTGDTGVAMGDFNLMQRGLLTLPYLEDADLLEGYTVVTSGKSGLYPPDLVIGKIIAVVSSSSGLDDYAILEPTADLSSLTNVYVVTEFTVSE